MLLYRHDIRKRATFAVATEKIFRVISTLTEIGDLSTWREDGRCLQTHHT